MATEGKVLQSTAASLHGLLNFASGFTLGKSLQMAAHGFSLLASGFNLPAESLRDLCNHSLIILKTLHAEKHRVAVEVWTLVGATWHWSDLTFIEPSVVELDYGKVSASDISSFNIALWYEKLHELI